VRSSTSGYAAAAAVLALSLVLKLAVSPAWAGHATPPPPRGEVLRRFLAATTVGGVEPIAAPAGEGHGAGWRFRSDDCAMSAYPSGPRGSFDLAAKSHARRRDRIAYVYRGELSATPPTWALAADVVLYRLTSAFRPENEPGYVVLIYPKTCAAPATLPWNRLPTS
jgi:hypothetical protein